MPILTGSAAYGLSEAFGWKYGLDRKPARAKQFYAVIVLATLLGVGINYLGINPIDALFWTAVINGVLAPPACGESNDLPVIDRMGLCLTFVPIFEAEPTGVGLGRLAEARYAWLRSNKSPNVDHSKRCDEFVRGEVAPVQFLGALRFNIDRVDMAFSERNASSASQTYGALLLSRRTAADSLISPNHTSTQHQ